jgi:1-deoxy-D-xylulose-5-phosphate reductoisomerase
MAGRRFLMGERKGVAILGSTGSIGLSTLEVIRRHPGRFRVVTLAAGTNTELLKEQIEEFRPEFVSVMTEEAAGIIKRACGSRVEVGFGLEGSSRAAAHEGANITVSAIVGAAGLIPTLAAIKAGKDIALANKETLVTAGHIVMEEVRKQGVRLLPVDSEHSAVFQILQGHRREDIRRIILTASGGPFLNLPLDGLENVTPDEALKHPNWKMGKRITIDSATLMNKGFEVIEARWLFDLPVEKISVYIHPQSIVHSMVEYIDGSIVAQMGSSDMKGPIAYALSYPERVEAGVENFPIAGRKLEFMEPEPERFPSLALAYKALSSGGTFPAVLNAADEVAVESFLERRIPFTGIYRTLAEVLEGHSPGKADSVEDILEADRWARGMAQGVVKKIYKEKGLRI